MAFDLITFYLTVLIAYFIVLNCFILCLLDSSYFVFCLICFEGLLIGCWLPFEEFYCLHTSLWFACRLQTHCKWACLGLAPPDRTGTASWGRISWSALSLSLWSGGPSRMLACRFQRYWPQSLVVWTCTRSWKAGSSHRSPPGTWSCFLISFDWSLGYEPLSSGTLRPARFLSIELFCQRNSSWNRLVGGPRWLKFHLILLKTGYYSGHSSCCW